MVNAFKPLKLAKVIEFPLKSANPVWTAGSLAHGSAIVPSFVCFVPVTVALLLVAIDPPA